MRLRKEEKEKAKLRAARRAHMREKIGLIPNFEKAILLFEGPSREGFCQHLRSKAWGDKYGKGVRCLDCGKEMTRTHEEPEQQAGLGGGDDPALWHMVHQDDEEDLEEWDGFFPLLLSFSALVS